MLNLITYAAGFGEISGSPFGVKAICLLVISGQEYKLTLGGDPRKTPKQKLPMLVHDGKQIPDSDQIRDYLEANFKVDFDAGLSAEQRAVSRAFIRMAEENIYFALVSTRWQRDENWPLVREEFFSMIPKVMRNFVTNMIRKKAIASVVGQGMGRHSEAEQMERIRKDLSAIVTLLGDKAFLFGETPTAADASIVPMLRAATNFPKATALSDLVNSFPSLAGYQERGKEMMYPK